MATARMRMSTRPALSGRTLECRDRPCLDDRYRPVRRHLHDSNTGKGGKRIPYSRGTVHGLRKGLLIGTPKGKRGRLCGIYNNAYRYHDGAGKRQVTRTVVWVCTNYLTTTIASADEADASFLSGL
jgi:hypothetical protein